jgi:uncharacterized protein (DUF488 family)
MNAAMKRKVYTIGYEGAEVDRFLTTLKDAGVAAVADVRAVALSRKKGFSKNQLRCNLAEAEIGYRHFIDLGTPKRAARPRARTTPRACTGSSASSSRRMARRRPSSSSPR